VGFGGLMRPVVDSTRTSGFLKNPKVAITLLLLGLTAITATYAKNALPRLWLNTRIMIGLACLEAKARVKGNDYVQAAQKKPLFPQKHPKSTYPLLHGGRRPSISETFLKRQP
jgi:hypothetical protein